MTWLERRIVGTGTMLVLFALVWPRWQYVESQHREDAGRALVMRPPINGIAEIDWLLVGVDLMTIAIVTAFLCWATRLRAANRHHVSERVG